jgi:hypothetical protein
MKRMQLNMGLFAAVVGLAVAVWVGRDKPEKLPPLTSLSQDAVTSISIAHPDTPEIKLSKQDGSWRLTAPVDAPTDPFEVSSLVGLAKLDVERSLALSEVDQKELKLDPPQYTITLNDQALAFGDAEPIKFRRYIKHGDAVALVSDPPSAALDADYSDLVSKDLLPKAAKIQRIEVPGLDVDRSSGAWVAEGHSDASADQLSQFVDAWTSAHAMWNAARPADAGDAGKPIRIVLADGEIKLRLIETEPQLVIDSPAYGVRYTLSKADADKLLVLPKPAPTPTPSVAPEATAAPTAADAPSSVPASDAKETTAP